MRLRCNFNETLDGLRRAVTLHRDSVAAVREDWRDARAEQFFRGELPPLEDSLKRLIAGLQKTLEFAQVVDRQTRDLSPDSTED